MVVFGNKDRNKWGDCDEETRWKTELCISSITGLVAEWRNTSNSLSPTNHPDHIWRFPKIGVPPVIIHFGLEFSLMNHPFGGTPIYGNPHLESTLVAIFLNRCPTRAPPRAAPPFAGTRQCAARNPATKHDVQNPERRTCFSIGK